MACARIPLRAFHLDIDGALSWFGILSLIFMLMFMGLAIDVTNAIQQRTHLQIAADTAAHAAIYTRDGKATGIPFTELQSKDEAINIAGLNMPSSGYGNVLNPADVVFGKWNAATETFVPELNSRGAVRVTTQQRAENNNAVSTYLLKLVGFDYWVVTTQSIFTTYEQGCLREGFVSEKLVDLQSNNNYLNGFCVHSNDKISMNSNNFFEEGTVVSLPSIDLLGLPKSGYETNVGLNAALHFGTMDIKLLARVRDIIIPGLRYPANVRNQGWGGGDWYRWYITSSLVKTIAANTIAQTDLASGFIHVKTCATTGSDKSLTIKKDTFFDRTVLWTNCPIKFETGVILEDLVVATASTGLKSIQTPSGPADAIQVGRKDNCAEGGGA